MRWHTIYCSRSVNGYFPINDCNNDIIATLPLFSDFSDAIPYTLDEKITGFELLDDAIKGIHIEIFFIKVM